MAPDEKRDMTNPGPDAPGEEPDVSEDPRGTDVGEGYPEEQEPGTSSPEGDVPDAHEDPPRAPSTRGPHDSGPGVATGNPDNAGA
jgi:hypothetical protein